VLGPADAIPDGEGREYRFGAGPSAFSMIVVRRGERAWGYLNLCPHFSLPLNGGGGRFTAPERGLVMCFNHFALFRFEDGLCVEGACEGEALDPVPVEIVGGLVRIAPEGASA
jgi:nitrite reductase/ring-hydroxylating ferredoxin subunit